MAQAILADTFPPQQRGLAFALYGITAVVAPTIGPTLGGWITYNYSLALDLLHQSSRRYAGAVSRFPSGRRSAVSGRLEAAGVKLDYIGIALPALGVGALQVMLDRGQEDDWFGSRFIVTLAIIAGIGLVSLVVWEWFTRQADHRRSTVQELQFSRRNVMMFTVGHLLFSSLVMMPQFLQTLLGYTAELAGLVLSGGAVVSLLSMPVVGALTNKVPGALHHRIRMVVPRCCNVLLHETDRLVDQFQFRHLVAYGAGQRPGFSFRSDHVGILYRYSVGEK